MRQKNRRFTLPSLRGRRAFMLLQQRDRFGFTLIELLVVITIIVILVGLLFPAFRGVQDQAKNVQAKNDVTQIVAAINAFYTEYGQYPCNAQGGDDSNDYFTSNDTDRKNLFDALRVPFPSTPPALNPRGIVFFQPPAVKKIRLGSGEVESEVTAYCTIRGALPIASRWITIITVY